VLIDLLRKSAEFKFEMFEFDQTFGKEEKEDIAYTSETGIVFLCCFVFLEVFFKQMSSKILGLF
jgi:hypothetical protein